jgi:hypothetical protein
MATELNDIVPQNTAYKKTFCAYKWRKISRVDTDLYQILAN